MNLPPDSLTLLVLRHAKASKDAVAIADHDRPLIPRGIDDARRIGAHLRQVAPPVELVLVSTARRTLETLDLTHLDLSPECETIATRDLYLTGPDRILQTIRRHGDRRRCVLVIGHNPGLQELVEIWLGPIGRLPTAAAARFEFAVEDWSHLSERTPARSTAWWTPRELEGRSEAG
ncbi:MAG TPA: histidine phosphatase [Planctomycetaceae bacterium]|nr:histidine phosphatase [Planctomycetaceae bacterium]HRF00787.1 histidine phosphatase family protein [Pirellulaceae bacterium]